MAPGARLRAAGVTAEGMRGRASFSGRPPGRRRSRRAGNHWHPQQMRGGRRSSRSRLSYLRRQVSSIRRGGWRAKPAATGGPAAAPKLNANRSGLLDPGLRLRRNRDDILWREGARKGLRALTAALATNGPRRALARGRGNGRGDARSSPRSQDVIPAAGEAGEPGTIGTLSRSKAEPLPCRAVTSPAGCATRWTGRSWPRRSRKRGSRRQDPPAPRRPT